MKSQKLTPPQVSEFLRLRKYLLQLKVCSSSIEVILFFFFNLKYRHLLFQSREGKLGLSGDADRRKFYLRARTLLLERKLGITLQQGIRLTRNFCERSLVDSSARTEFVSPLAFLVHDEAT